MKSVKREGHHLDDQARSSFKSAWNDVQEREHDLKRSLRDANNSSSADWEATRTKLAADYQAYENAVARAQSQAVGNTLNSSSWNSSGAATTAPDSSTSGNRATDNALRVNSTATDSSGASTGGNNGQATSSTTTSHSANQ